MGVAMQFIFFVQLMYQMVAIGASILISQNLGASQSTEARKTAAGSILLVAGFGVVLSLGLGLGAPAIVGLYGLNSEVAGFTTTFLVLFGAGSLTTGLSILFSTLLRVWGHTRSPMVVNIAASAFNVGANALVLFGWFGFPVLGIAGVAWATGLAQGLAALALWGILRSRTATRIGWTDLKEVKGPIFRSVLAVGIPTAGENLSYNLAQIVNLRVISSLGTESLTAYVYVLSWLRFVFTPSQALGFGAQTKVGWWVGSGHFDLAYRRVLKWCAAGAGISFGLMAAVFLFHKELIEVYTRDPRILAIAGTLFLIGLVYEPGRNLNLVIIPALKGSGDVRYPVTVGIIFMWILGVGGSWLLGVGMGWGLVGVWLALASDEWTRGLLVFARWRSGRWRSKVLFSTGPIAFQSVTIEGQPEP